MQYSFKTFGQDNVSFKCCELFLRKKLTVFAIFIVIDLRQESMSITSMTPTG
jgi:hypothetical protein